ncbi:MAG: hypothetical protein ACYTGP_08485 [Planctomycetota bacterium]|jgi:hypothetical protein
MNDTSSNRFMYCRSCGYPLAHAEATRCSECGRGFDVDDPRTWAARPPSRFAGMLVLLRHALAIGLLAFLGWACWVMLGIDQWVGASVSAIFVIICVGLGAAVISLAWALGRSRWYLAPSVPFAVFMAVLVLADLSPIKPILRALDDIVPGMTRQQAKAMIDAQFPVNGRFPRPVLYAEDEQTIRYRVDPTDGRYNAALVVIRFDGEEGTVSSARFVPD